MGRPGFVIEIREFDAGARPLGTARRDRVFATFNEAAKSAELAMAALETGHAYDFDGGFWSAQDGRGHTYRFVVKDLGEPTSGSAPPPR